MIFPNCIPVILIVMLIFKFQLGPIGPTKEKSSVKGGRDISVLFCRSKNSPVGPISELIIDSSSDDGNLLLFPVRSY